MRFTERLRYGTGRHQFGTLHVPRSQSRPNGVVVLVHGGFWRWPFNRWVMALISHDAVRRGFAVLNVEYRRLGRFGGGGGWPATFDDVTDAVTTVSHRFPDLPLWVVGHSAGGHLALFAAARLAECVDGVVSVSAPTDLRTMSRRGSDAVDELVAGAPLPDRWSLTSPIEMLPTGVPTVCVHGEDDTTVLPEMSVRYVEAALAAGDDARLVLVSGEGHRSVLLASSQTWRAVIESLDRWADGGHAVSRNISSVTKDGG